jgi:hypothetical protein
MIQSSGYPHASRRRNLRRNILREREYPEKFEVRNLIRIPLEVHDLTWQTRETMPN